MRPLQLAAPGERLSILCLGAHADDIEIGAGATLLGLIERGIRLQVHWLVLSGGGSEREKEAKNSASEYLSGAAAAQIEVMSFRDGLFPEQGEAIKAWFETLKPVKPDLILTHRRDDAHQDHRLVSRMTWNTFRDHAILEYEIPKWDGDMGRPNVYMPLSKNLMQRKIDLLMKHYSTQRARHWFDPETFRGLARLRGIECAAPDGYAEAFIGRKLQLG